MTRGQALRVFELDDRCTQEQVRAAYRELVKVWHPDRFVNDAALRMKAERRLQEINRAYAVLQQSAASANADPPPPPVRSADATLSADEHSNRARWSLASFVAIGLLCGTLIGGLLIVLVPLQKAPEPPKETTPPTQDHVQEEEPVSKRPSLPRPLSGTDLLSAPVSGDTASRLMVLNADRRDAVLVFAEADVQTRAVYIRAGETLQMLDVPLGTYRIWIAQDRGWDHDHFTADPLYQELDEPLIFTPERSSPRTVTIAAPGARTRTPLRARAPFVLNVVRLNVVR